MGACGSKRLMPLDRQLHKEVPHGSIERIRALRAQAADLESTDSLRKTPLMKASAWPGPGMALVLIELGADINAYRRANPYLRNDYGETALELARRKGHLYVVWAIERCICLFRGCMREKYGADSFMTNKIWAVVLPCEAQNPTRPLKLELAIYHALQNSKPHAVIELWKSQIEEGKLNEEDPSITIFDKETESRYEILSADEGDKHMLQRFYDAFHGTAEVVNPVPAQPAEPPIPRSLPATSSLAHSYAELARAKAEGVPNVQPSASSAYMDDWGRLRSNSLIGRYGRPDAPAPLMISGHAQVDTKRSSRHNGRGMAGTSYNQKSPDASSGEPVESEAKMTNNGNPWRRCVICLDAAVEGACVPCEHMAFCMPCLKDIKSKNGACPICRAAINQVIRLYQV
ncbi:probable E3 ubiquitin-protein ligase XBOS34 isoform X2 [Panicum hallii]|nr:probable E3 ubiquitin-protein ligase XBOS34 isoform X2 [Panicum hallii]